MKRLFKGLFEKKQVYKNNFDDDLRWLDDYQIDSLNELSDHEIDESLKKFQRRFRKVRFREVRNRYIQIAAVFLVVFGTTIYGVKHYQNRASINSSDFLLPATGIATLEFEDGQVVAIDESIADESLFYKGIVVEKDTLLGLVFRQDVDNHVGRDQSVKYHTLTTPKGGVVTLTLEDGTVVSINADSKVVFPETFKGADNRKILVEGEVFLKVHENTDQPFIVSVLGREIEVLGTEFNVNGYNQKEVSTTLKEGKVAFRDGFGGSLFLEPGEQVVSNAGGMKKLKVDLNKELDWKNGDFYFDQTPLVEVMMKLSRWYNVDIHVKDYKKNIKLNGVISRKRKLNEVLALLEKTGNFTHSMKGRRVNIE